MKRVVVKVGSFVLKKDNALEKICEFLYSLKQVYEVILVTSGAVDAGSKILKLDKKVLTNRQALSAIGQPYLMKRYSQILEKYSISTAQFLLTDGDFNSIKSTNNARCAIEVLIRNGILPIINENDATSTYELIFGDNDTLSAKATYYFNADTLIILSAIESFHGKKEVDNISKEELNIKPIIDPTSSVGGLKTKLEAAQFLLKHKKSMFLSSGIDLKDAYSFFIEHKHIGGTIFR